MNPQILHMICYWFLFALIVLLLFALARVKSERGAIEEKEMIIEVLSEDLDEQKQLYEWLLKKKNDSIARLQEQVNFLNNEVARLHGRSGESFVKD